MVGHDFHTFGVNQSQTFTMFTILDNMVNRTHNLENTMGQTPKRPEVAGSNPAPGTKEALEFLEESSIMIDNFRER